MYVVQIWQQLLKLSVISNQIYTTWMKISYMQTVQEDEENTVMVSQGYVSNSQFSDNR